MPVFSYRTIQSAAEDMYKEKGNKFMAFAYRIMPLILSGGILYIQNSGVRSFLTAEESHAKITGTG
jgi:hypothetical protein